REGRYLVWRDARGERGQDRGVDASGQQHPYRDIGEEVGADGFAQTVAELRRQLLRRLFSEAALGRRLGARVADQAQSIPSAERDVPRGELAGCPVDRERRGHRVECQERLQRLRIDLPREVRLSEQGLQL